MLPIFQALLSSHYNQSQALQRAAVAKAQGLDPDKYGAVLPGSTVNHTTTTNTTTESGGYIKGALLGAALLTGGAVPTAAVLWPGGKAVPAAQAVTQPPTERATPARSGWDAVYEERQPDGSWKQVKRERLTPKE